MSTVIIGIHGLGNKPPKNILEKWWIAALKEGLNRIDPDLELPEFELIYWADILNPLPLDPTLKDHESPYFLKEVYQPATENLDMKMITLRKKVFDFLEEGLDKYFLNEDLTSNYTFLSDIVIKKYFFELHVYFAKDYKDGSGKLFNARDIIKGRCFEALNRHQGKQIMLVAHSMGSIIAYDVLSFLHPELTINTFITMGSPLGLPFVISKIAADEKFRLSGKRKLSTPPGVMKNWYNFADPEDRIAFDKTLNDDYAKNENDVKVTDFSIYNDYVTDGKRNPHKSFGYLRSKEFSNILNEFIQDSRKKKEEGFFHKVNNFIRALVKKPKNKT